MKTCLSEESLLLLYEGEGSCDEQTHLAKCQICTIRYERLGKDLKLLGQVLREPPPQTVEIRERRSPMLRWVPVAMAGAAAALLLSWSLDQVPEMTHLPVPTRPHPAPTSADEVQDEELARFLTKVVGPAIFSTTDFVVASVPQRATNLAYLKAALDGGWPLDRCEEDRPQQCDGDPFALLFDQDDE